MLNPSPSNPSLELGNFKASHRVWKVVAALSLSLGGGLIALGVALEQLSPALWGMVGFCLAFAGFTWGLTRVMQSSLRIDSRGLVRASKMRERVTPWMEISGARVGIAELGDHLPCLIVEGSGGKVLATYGMGLISPPLEEAARLINEARLRPPGDIATRISDL